MKFLQKLSGAALLSAALLFTACQKDKDPGNSVTPAAPATQKTCKLNKIIYSDFYEEYIYDNNGKIISINTINALDSSLMFAYRYTYNSAGKANEEIKFNASNVAENKRVFTYNSNMQLTRIDFYDGKVPGGINQLSGYILFQYNSAGQRILAQHYPASQASNMDFYSVYNYAQNKVLIKEYNAKIIPAIVIDSTIIYFDNKKSYNALGYLHTYYPELDKHNIIYIKEDENDPSNNKSYDYEYNNLDYPVKVKSWYGMFGRSATYEYDCN